MKAWKHAGLMAGATFLGETANKMRQDQAEAKYEAKSERLRQAQLRDAQMIEATRAQFASAKDERDHEQSKELKDMDLTAAEKRQQAQQSGADRRSQASIDASDRRASTSAASRERAAEIRANRPSGTGTQAKAQLFANDNGEQQWIVPGEEIPPGYFRAPQSGRPAPSAKPKAAPAAKPDPNAPPVPGARKAPDGKWYVQQGGKWHMVEQ